MHVSDDETAPDDERAPDDDEATPAGTTPTKREVPAWVKRFGDAVVARLPRLSAPPSSGGCCCA